MRTLLIADDERTIREGIASSINWEMFGIDRVLLSSNGREAYETIKRERPDIAILDIIMPEMTGIEIISRFRREGGGPEFVIISGYEEFEYAREAIRNHVKDYILKPCDIGEITNTIEKIMAEMEHRQSIEEERLHLKENIDLFMPQAREQILRDYISGSSAGSLGMFAKVFGQCCREFQILIFRFDDEDDYAGLPVLRKCVDRAPGIKGWKCSTILFGCVVLVFDAGAGTAIRGVVDWIGGEAARFSITGIRVAISGKGAINNLPELYRETWEAIKLLTPIPGGEKDEVPLIEAGTAHYCTTVRQVIQYVKDNLSDSSLSLNHIAADVLYLNPDYLGKLFKRECGIKFSDYLMAVRMEKAKQIIAASSGLRMYEVARLVGLGDDAAYFGQVFRKYTGLLPSEYRMKHGG